MQFGGGCPVPRTIPLPPSSADVNDLRGNYLLNNFVVFM